MGNSVGKNRDGHFESEEALKVAKLVRALPEDELSLAWRSELNAKLKALETQRKSASLAKPLGWLAGVGATALAAAALFLALMPTRTHHAALPPSQELERQMLTAHFTSVGSSEVAGEGLSYLDDPQPPSTDSQEFRPEDSEPL